ncbi:hypothetical protein Xmau_03591 [Xenorhabdus mauleonii]|uniref:Uncharacterized protein n=1 Tax=Xenorhabdus mauleonii TaxID=351675 RepID=A0A2G0NTY2_9GAMM|nr:hypothetical protein [Xenorhabdus mauleonii]PHM38204.1 hypothetical protein Xmau_03591 [Xenorhabdus mauleonii]
MSNTSHQGELMKATMEGSLSSRRDFAGSVTDGKPLELSHRPEHPTT